MEILESRNIELVGHSDLNGSGDGMQIMLNGDALYVGHMGYNGIGTSILDVSDPENPRVVRQIPIAENTHSHKVQHAGDIMLVENGCVHQHFNDDPDEEAVLLVFKAKPHGAIASVIKSLFRDNSSRSTVTEIFPAAFTASAFSMSFSSINNPSAFCTFFRALFKISSLISQRITG